MKREVHHIVPRCEGGTNGSENLIKLSSRAHAILSVYQSEHYQRCCLHPRQVKFLPEELKAIASKWLREAALVTRDIVREKLKHDPGYSERYKRLCSKRMQERWGTVEGYLGLVEAARTNIKKAHEVAMGEEASRKRKKTFELIKHQQQEKNSQYGTMWVTNGLSNQKIKREDSIPEGYWKGRTL